jgi:hypothetical protein
MNNVPPLILVGYTTLTNSISNTLTSMAVTNRQIEDWASQARGSKHRSIAAKAAEATHKMKSLLEVTQPKQEAVQRNYLEHASQEQQQEDGKSTEELLAFNNQYDIIFNEWSQVVEQWEETMKAKPAMKDGLPARFGYVCRRHDFGTYC